MSSIQIRELSFRKVITDISVQDDSYLRHFRAKPDKKFADVHAASPSSWKTPCMATFMAW